MILSTYSSFISFHFFLPLFVDSNIDFNGQVYKESFSLLSGVDLIAAFYGCLYVGCVPVTIRPPHPQNIATTLPTVKMIVEVSKSSAILTNSIVHKLLKSKASEESFQNLIITRIVCFIRCIKHRYMYIIIKVKLLLW